MKESRGRVNKFKIGDFVAIKIDKVNKTSPLHPNVLLGKVIEVQEQSNNPKYAVWSLKVKYTVLLIPVYLEVGIIGRCGKKEFKLFVRDTVFF